MDFDGYVQYMIQKYSLAVALSVIKTKPNDIDIEKHLNNIKNKIRESKMDSYDEICDKDFQFNDSESEINNSNNESNDSVTILKDYDVNNLNLLDKENVENFSNSFLNVFENINDFDQDPNNMNTTTTFIPGSQNSQNTLLNVREDLTFCESPNEIECNNKLVESDHNDIRNNDSEQTELYTVPDINTHISQSQDIFVVSKKLIAKAYENTNETMCNSNNRQAETTNIISSTEFLTESNREKYPKSLTISLECVDEIDNSKRGSSEEILCKAKRIRANNGDNEIDILKKSQESYNLLDTDLSKKKLSQNVSSFDEFEYFSTQSSQNLNIKFTNKDINNKSTNEINELIYNINERECISDDSNISDDLTKSQAEIVTFKVLEELSKVKNYLRRENRHTDSDSGFKSSQTSASYKNALSGTCWNESAQCLLNFLNNCPLVDSVMDIIEEISKVLGKFIDKLHVEEKYPKFLEEMLEDVENYINNVYNYSRCDGDTILKIDENIQRVFLLNRSPHIIKFSVEKITNILENIIPEFQNVIEITQTEQSENLCHILHILEILLKRYFSYEIYSSQVSSQETSQESILKKSSLTEIWRKKWNLTKSEVFQVQRSEKKCIMTKCRDILNKITVEAMECYSLVSFLALQCYNILQK